VAATCRKCRSDRARRSRTRNRWERWRKQLTGKVLFRCPDCGWRGWATDPGASVVAAAPVSASPDPPNLQHSPLARTGRAEIRLEELDRIE
jgi:hypothetical protein